MESKFKPGDIVKQKTGSVHMTVTKVHENDTYDCYWEISGTVKTDTLPEDILMIVPEPISPTFLYD